MDGHPALMDQADGAVEVSVVVPMFRTAAALPELHGRLAKALDGRSWELVLVDDACPDGSGALAERLAAGDGRVRCVRHSRTLGQHPSLMDGLRHSAGAAVVLMDGDLEDPPEKAPALLAALADGADAAFAVDGPASARRRTRVARVYKRTVRALTRAPAAHSTFIALDRQACSRLTALRSTAGLPVMVAAVARNAAAVPVDRPARRFGTSSYTRARRVALAARNLRWLLWFYGTQPAGSARARWPIAAVAVSLTGITALWLGFGYDVWPGNDLLAYALHYDGQLQGDWVTGLATSHWPAASFLGAVPAWALEPVVAACWVAALLALWLGFALLADSLALTPLMTLSAGLLLLPTQLDGLGSSGVLIDSLYPDGPAFALALCGIAMLVRRRPVAAGALIGAATLVHPGVGTLAVLIVAPAAVAVFGLRLRPLAAMALPAALIAAPSVIHALVTQVGGAELSATRRVELLAFVRTPYHVSFPAFPVAEKANFASCLLLLGFGLFVLRRHVMARVLATIVAAILVLVAAGTIATAAGGPLTLVQLQPGRVTPFAVAFAVLLACGVLERRLPSHAWGVALAAFVLGDLLERPVGGQVAAHAVWARPAVTQATVQAVILLAALALTASWGGARLRMPRGRLAAALPGLLAVSAGAVIVHAALTRPRAGDPMLRAVAVAARDHSAPRDLVLIPPGAGDFTVLARRPTVVTFGIFRYGSGDAEWARRIDAVTGHSGALAVRPFRYDAAARVDYADRQYGLTLRRSPASICRYGVRLVVDRRGAPPPRWLARVYANERYELFAVRPGTCPRAA